MSSGGSSVPVGRVVAVAATLRDGREQLGSGYLVGGRLVLTAEHCTRDKAPGEPAARLRVVRASDGAVAQVAEVVPDRGLDVAVLRLADGAPWDADLPFPVFARVDQSHTGVLDDCAGIGFPLFQGDPDRRTRHTVEFHGRIYQTDERESGHLLMREPLIQPGPITGPGGEAESGRGEEGSSPWGGLSGALIFCRGSAIGVVVEHHPLQGDSALRAIGFERIAASAELQQYLGLSGPDSLPWVSELATMAGKLGRVLIGDKDRGGGFALGPRLVVTANHVVRGHEDQPVIYVPTGGKAVGIERLQPDVGHDAAILWLASDVGEFLSTSGAEPGARWQSPPAGAGDPVLTGTVSTPRMTIQNAGGQPVEMMQLLVDQQLGDYAGYAGNAVLDSLGQTVLGLLVEQVPLRMAPPLAERRAVANVLYGVPIGDVITALGLPVQTMPPERRRPSSILTEGERVMAVALTPASLTGDESPFALVGRENEVGYYHLDTGVRLGGHDQTGPIYSLTSVPGTRQVLSGGRDGTGRVWDLGTTSALRELLGHTAQINGVATDPDGGLAATASDDGTVRVWDLKSAQPRPLSVFSGAEGYANAVLFAEVSGRSMVVSGNADGTLRAFALSGGTALWVADSAQGPIHAMALARYDGRPVVVAGQDSGECLIASLDGGQPVVRFHAHDGPVRGIATVNGSVVASVGSDGVVRLWNLDAQDLDPSFLVPGGELAYGAAGPGWSVAAARINDELCVVSGHDRGALVWMLDMPGRPTAERPHTYFAGVLADGTQGQDRLGISAEVNTLCDVIMAREVTPPLSVGLFGDWGTGKSFFMGLMQKRIARLAEASERARLEGVETGLCAGVCQIEFNAWHYIDTNLWASLASRIFNELAATDDRPDMQQMMQDLPSVRTLRQNTEERRRQAEARLAAIDTEFQKEGPVGIRDITVANLAEIRDSLPKRVGERVDDVLEKAGVPKENVEELDLRSTLPQMHEVGGRLIFLMQRGKWTVRLVLVLALALVVAGPPVLTLLLRPYLGDLTAGLTSLITCLVAALLVARPYLSRVSYFLKVAENAVTNVDKQRQSVMQARREAFQRRIATIHTEIETLDAQIDSLNEIDSVHAFALKRLADDEYRRQEGLLALLRRDLEELSRRLAPARTDDRTAGRPGPDMERIILYIDDLDRCPADRVVQVLQAIHLLLAFPLFVVIVGVDSRWLLRSLRTHYRDVLGAPERRALDADNSGGEHWAATPQNYLEKIFQISLCLRPMSRSGYADLVTADIGGVIEDRDNAPADSPGTETPPPADALSADEGKFSEQGTKAGTPGALAAPPPAQEPGTKSVQPRMIHAFAGRGQILAIEFSPRFSLTQPVLLSVTAAGHITRREPRRGWEVLADHITETTVAAARLTIDDRVLIIEEPALDGTRRFGRIVDSRTGEETTTIDVSSDDGLRASNVVISQSGKEIVMSWVDDEGRPHGYSEANAADRIVFDAADRDAGVPLLLASSWRVVAGDDGACYWMANEQGSSPVLLQAAPASRFVTDQKERRFAAVGAAALQVWSVGAGPVPVPLPQGLSGSDASPGVIAFGPDALLATAIGRSVKIWDLTAAHLRAEVVTDSTVTAIGISADGRRLAVGGDDGSIQLWLIAEPRRNEEFASEALRLTRSEATTITAMESLIRTPRSARRLINTYRLLRAGLRPDELDQLRSQDHAAVILLLAMLTAFPPQSADLLEQLIGSTDRLPGTLTELIQSHLRMDSSAHGRRLHPTPSADFHAWRRLATAVARVRTETSLQSDIDVYRRWAPHVARFSFRTGHLL
jgi:WD40 repeat protein